MQTVLRFEDDSPDCRTCNGDKGNHCGCQQGHSANLSTRCQQGDSSKQFQRRGQASENLILVTVSLIITC